MIAINRFVLHVSIVLLASEKLFAEVHNCNGSWTNKPCEGEITESFEEYKGSNDVRKNISEVPMVETDVPLAQRNRTVEEVRRMNSDYKRKFGIDLASSSLEFIKITCRNRTIPFDQCKEQRDKLVAELESKRAAQEHTQIEQEKLRQQKISNFHLQRLMP